VANLVARFCHAIGRSERVGGMPGATSGGIRGENFERNHSRPEVEKSMAGFDYHDRVASSTSEIALTPPTDPAIQPAASDADDIPVVEPVEDYRPPRGVPVYATAPRWVRGLLLFIAAIFTTLFVTAAWLRPYDDRPRTMETHTQLGLPPCNLVVLTGKPCPSCGMTTSFSLLMHGDVANSFRANWVGTLIALYWLALIPWAVASAVRGKLLFVPSGDWLMTVSVIAIFVLMLGRWAVVLWG
jgi:hypothetical protein